MTKYRIIKLEAQDTLYFGVEERLLFSWFKWPNLFSDIETAKLYIERDKKRRYQEKHPEIVYQE